jgi:hypothetical protein
MGLKSAKNKFKEILNEIKLFGLWRDSNLFGKIFWTICSPLLIILYFGIIITACFMFLKQLGLKEKNK